MERTAPANKRGITNVPVDVCCGFEGCTKPATIRIRTKGWTNCCFDHYMSWHQEKALAYTREKGLYTQEAQVKFCSPILHKIFRHRKNGLVEF